MPRVCERGNMLCGDGAFLNSDVCVQACIATHHPTHRTSESGSKFCHQFRPSTGGQEGTCLGRRPQARLQLLMASSGTCACQCCSIVQQLVFGLWLVELPLRSLSYLLPQIVVNVDLTRICYFRMLMAEAVMVLEVHVGLSQIQNRRAWAIWCTLGEDFMWRGCSFSLTK